jgi:hypothetical protein
MEPETVELENRKERRQKRIRQKENHIKRQVKIAKSAGMDISEPHRFAKHNALDCGIAHCLICHPNPKREPTIQEKKIREYMECASE